VFSGLREAPKGEVRLDVACEVDSQGILALTAVDRDTGQEVEAKLKLGEPQGVSKPKRKKKREERSAIPTPLEMPVESSLTAESSEAAKTEAPPARVEPPKAAEPPPATPEPAEEPSASEPAAGGTGLRRKTNLGGNAGKASAPAPQPPAPAEGLIGRLIAWLRGLFGKK
jgi:molecular chaperone DnaK (HSP70)